MPKNATSLKLKLVTKKLGAGDCQVKFYGTNECNRNFYGYALVNSKLTLKEVVENLEYKIKSSSYKPYCLNAFLSKRQKEYSPIKNFLIFKS